MQVASNYSSGKQKPTMYYEAHFFFTSLTATRSGQQNLANTKIQDKHMEVIFIPHQVNTMNYD